jgi:hypothetical protein
MTWVLTLPDGDWVYIGREKAFGLEGQTWLGMSMKEDWNGK